MFPVETIHLIFPVETSIGGLAVTFWREQAGGID
jgi:hypothetical protein